MITKMPKRGKKKKDPSSLNVGSRLFLLGVAAGAVGSFAYMSVTESDIHEPLQSKTLRACFSPEGQCEHDILRSIVKAKHSIKVHAYTLTSPAIADALLDAKGRGVDVVLLVDSSQMTSKYSKVKQLLQSGIPVFLDKVPGLAHNKIMIIDDALLLTGSYNWSNAAHKRNAENLLFINDQGLLNVYLNNWNRHLDQAMRMSSGLRHIQNLVATFC